MPKWLRRLFGIRDDPKPAPQIAPQPTIAPAVGQPYVPPAPIPPAPVPDPTAGATDIYGRPVPTAPYGRRQDGYAFQSQAEAEAYWVALKIRDDNLAEAGRLTQAQVFHGPIAYTDAPDEDLKFVTYAQHNYRLPMGLFYAVYSGPKPEIDQLIGKGDRIGVGYNAETYPREGRMRGLVDQYSKGLLKVNATH